MTDQDTAAPYESPENREPLGPARRRRGQQARLTRHVPVRFSRETIDRVQILADRDGMTVSTWIRNLVENEVQRRLQPTFTGLSTTTVRKALEALQVATKTDAWAPPNVAEFETTG